MASQSQSTIRVLRTPEAAKAREEHQTNTSNSGGKPEHWVDAKGSAFRNPWPSWRDHDSRDNFYIIFQHQRQYPPIPPNISDLIPVRKPTWGLDVPQSKVENKIKATWLGHACFLVEFPTPVSPSSSSSPPSSPPSSSPSSPRGARVLFDPVFSERCSPSQWVGPKRFTPVPCAVEEIPPVDVIVISHNHYDHLDTTTIKTLFTDTRNPLAQQPHIFAPLGNANYFDSLNIPRSNVHILDWWDSRRVEISFPVPAHLPGSKLDASVTVAIDVTCTPAQHFTGRGLFDRFKSLWASWVIEEIGVVPLPNSNSNSTTILNDVNDNNGPGFTINPLKIFFAGDTGYRAVLEGQDIDNVPRCPAFKQIGDKFGPFDFAMIPIGAYLPQRFMSPIHCSPADSVLLFKDIKAKRALGMHWGAWVLTLEEVTEPPKKLQDECEKAGIEPGVFDTCEIGETVII